MKPIGVNLLLILLLCVGSSGCGPRLYNIAVKDSVGNPLERVRTKLRDIGYSIRESNDGTIRAERLSLKSLSTSMAYGPTVKIIDILNISANHDIQTGTYYVVVTVKTQSQRASDVERRFNSRTSRGVKKAAEQIIEFLTGAPVAP